MTAAKNIPIVLTIAGSDSGGGAGIQADIKAISATGSYACSAITALTAQNTQGVSGIYPIDPAFVEQQLDALFADLDIRAVKVGMLSDSTIIQSVAKKLTEYSPKHLVVDPVMVATSGDLLLQASAIDTLKSKLLPLANLITPNLAEAAALVDRPIPTTAATLEQLMARLASLPTQAVLLKGGHVEQGDKSTDFLLHAGQVTPFSSPRIDTPNTHGTGCTLSSAIASFMAQDYPLSAAVQQGKNYISQAIAHADKLSVGRGHGPVHHFYGSQVHG